MRRLLLIAATGLIQTAQAMPLTVGERIYRDGLITEGRPLEGTRDDAISVSGAAAACTSCHRRSGLGSAEGTSRIPPITAKFLFAPPGVRPTAYTDATLARAIRTGVGSDGRALSYLMPRFALEDAPMTALIGYLKSLPTAPAPGVTDTTLHFATIVTPDADPAARDGMLQVLKQFETDKNSFIRGGRRPMKTGGQIDFRVTRSWEIHVWQLKGPPQSWRGQLEDDLKAQPVFAVLSGLAAAEWGPVHDFCERQSLPCLFPNVEAPTVAERDFYPLYLSKGVLLEADLMGARLRGDTPAGGRVIQVYRTGDSGQIAARALHAAAAPSVAVLDLPIAGGYGRSSTSMDLSKALGAARAGDTVVLWLRPADLAQLPAPPANATIWISGLLAGLDFTAMPEAWRHIAHLTYPVDLPTLRRLRMVYPLNWFKIKQIPVVAERVQADTYLACGIVSEALADVTGNFQRDYLIERIEMMLGHRQLSGFYPRLGLASGQRFASKGGYWVSADDAAPAGLRAEGEWTIP